MTNRFMDSFDHYTDLTQKWDNNQNATISATAGRYGTSGLDLSYAGVAYVKKDFTDFPNGWAVGVAYYRNDVPTGSDLITIYDTIDGDNRQVGLFVNYAGNLGVSSSGSTIFTTTKIVQPNSWYYIELLTSIGMSNLSTIYVNGNLWGSGTGVTQSSGSAWGNAIRISNAGRPYIDDVYMNTTSGSINNTVWGDVRIEPVYPDGDGFWQQWTPSTGSSRWEITSNNPPDVGEYISSGSLGAKSTFTMTDLSAGTGAIKAVQQMQLTAKNDITVRETRNFTRLPSGTEYPSDVNTITNDLKYYITTLENRPDAVAWTETTLGETQFGIEVVS